VEVTIRICMVFGYDLLCDLLETLNFNKYLSAVATRRNLVDPILSKNKRPDGLAVRTFDLRTEGYNKKTARVDDPSDLITQVDRLRA
jgi:hypothetical protein